MDLAVDARPALLLTNTASLCVGFALFAILIGTASYVQAPPASGYGFGASIVVSGLCLLPSGLAMLALSPVSALDVPPLRPEDRAVHADRWSSRSASWSASC